MKLHVNTGYAIQILQYLHIYSGVPQNVIKLSEFICVANTTVVRIVRKLKNGGLLKSIQGRSGGYCLGKSAYEISLYDVFVCMGGELQVRSRHGDVCGLQQNWIEYISGVPIAALESNSFEDGMVQSSSPFNKKLNVAGSLKGSQDAEWAIQASSEH